MIKNIIYFIISFAFSVANLNAQIASKAMKLAYSDSAHLVAIFKDLHQNPELSFMEVRTSGIVAKELKNLGFEVITGLGKTGVVGILKNGNGPVVMYRADMDALPVKEATGLAYACNYMVKKDDGSEVPVMHACGHDAHTTWLLGVAKIMVTLKAEWKGTLVMLAQPAEEYAQGARAMVDDSMYTKGVPVPDFLFGMHTKPLPVGTIENVGGERAAGTDMFDVTFKGIGGHGSAPEFTKDPIVMASNAVLQYQTIISRNIPALDAAVLTVGSFQAGTANNIIPTSALLKLNIRWFTDKNRNLLIDNIKRINEGIALGNNLPADLYPTLLMKGYTYPLINNHQLVEKVNTALSSVIGENNIISKSPAEMGSEDFPNLLGWHKTIKYDYLLVGIAAPDAVKKSQSTGQFYPFFFHANNYLVDLTAIPFGTGVGAIAVLELFVKK